ncbi:protein kinase domain-containing protein [Streptomyces olivochromogenes]|uniref:serine/threonine-protein kinase n=1 Tax=Streptomyces olivochromogenes TaxID=1963 RepID=UPI001F3B87A9|nr:serine/threonine-protein kinase [Streptomyces olivochromogenes]MCF3131810.1 PQQ-binding-like beta-propeller repeat protein [Streptomyces olivochromogenes]
MTLHKDDPRSVGGYRLVDRLGAGGMGVVYRGRARSGREVAVKVVHAQYAQDAVFRTRFRQEIAAVRKVSGAFTAPVVDADPEADRPWMATQYVPGPSLADRIRVSGPLRSAALRPLALGLVEALRDIHRVGVVHRDLKPANVLMAEDGPRVIDFGISRATENQTLTETGHMIGTPPFMSPEQLTDARSVGPASDVFSLAALLVYAVTGRGPFDEESPYLTAYRVISEEPVLDGVGRPLLGILVRCLAKDPAARPELDELAREFADALPEPAPGDLPTVTLCRPALDEESQHYGALAERAVMSPVRRRRSRSLLAATGTVGAVALGLTAYFVLGPGLPGDAADDAAGTGRVSPSASAVSRWGPPPAGWRPWQTTVRERAPVGAAQALDMSRRATGGGGLSCEVSAGAVYCGGEGVLPVRLDARTGKTLWRAVPRPAIGATEQYTSRVLGVRDGAVLVTQSAPAESPQVELTRVTAFDIGTGKQLWTRTVNDGGTEIAFTGDLVLTPGADGRSVTARAPRTGRTRWTAPLPANRSCGLVTFGEGLYAQCDALTSRAADTDFLVIDPGDGSTRRLTTPAGSSCKGTVARRLVCLQWDEGESDNGPDNMAYARILLLDPDTGKRQEVEPAQKLHGQPTVEGGMLFLARSSGEVTAVSPGTGKQVWRIRTTLQQPGRPVLDDRTHTLYLSSAAGRVAALDARRGTVLWESPPRAERVTGAGWDLADVLVDKGTLVVDTPDGTVFALDPGHPTRNPVAAG